MGICRLDKNDDIINPWGDDTYISPWARSTITCFYQTHVTVAHSHSLEDNDGKYWDNEDDAICDATNCRTPSAFPTEETAIFPVFRTE